MNSVTLIWQEVPDDIYIYNLEVNDEELALLRLCNEQYINSVDPGEIFDALEVLGNRIYDEKTGKKLLKHINTGDKPVMVKKSELIVSGFIL